MHNLEVSLKPGQEICISIKITATNEIEVKDVQRFLSLDEILDKVSTAINIPPQDILSKSRKTNNVFARYIFMYVAVVYYRYSKNKLGEYLKMNHTSATHGVNEFKNLYEQGNAILMPMVRQVQFHFPFKIKA